MKPTKRKAPIAANNQGGIRKTSKHDYRTAAATFHHGLDVLSPFFKQSDKGQGVNHASC